MAGKTVVLQKIRAFMKDPRHVSEALQAYIIPSTDAHMSEYLADHDTRRHFVTGFTGSAGTACITEDSALLWTDSRYYLQAEAEINKDLWTLMKDGLPKTPPLSTWLCKNLPPNSRIGVDPTYISSTVWNELTKKMIVAGHSLTPVATNFVDLVWDHQPSAPSNPIKVLPKEFSGKPWKEKIVAVQKKLDEAGTDVIVVTELDQIAWLFNLRGSDITYNPVFFAYAAVTAESAHLFVDPDRVTPEIRQHLTVVGRECSAPVFLHPYESVEHKKKVLVPNQSSAAFMLMVPKELRVQVESPIAELKAVKNSTESSGMRNCHVRDGAAVVRFFAWLENELENGREVTEISAAEKLAGFRKEMQFFVDLSFDTISGVGEHCAIPHYRSTDESNVPVSKNLMYLCDSGAQYLDGTTDITRTVHFGNPTPFEKEAFTRVLKGHIGLASIVFPSKTKGVALDGFARQSLWSVGLDYGHGTGHGVGAYLNVHEGPSLISQRHKPSDPGLVPGMFFSNEPGYYEDGKFGIRIENVVEVVKVKTPHNFQEKDFLGFETVSYAPIHIGLIDRSLMTKEEIQWLNNYHRDCRQQLTPVLQSIGDEMALKWLEKETRVL
ncbi:unnamed protein product [Notodromas monacha]|uniref:Xaa-Pro aminopeptidase n=1 Tax=Notodromas monacha TaxID=399045 RepID=A0A7R9BHA7_9CRUS|nr:unnamed protein product [Notodromas monacha]CAG0915481.1 unnamed protein product [Notodromas monacha]